MRLAPTPPSLLLAPTLLLSGILVSNLLLFGCDPTDQGEGSGGNAGAGGATPGPKGGSTDSGSGGTGSASDPCARAAACGSHKWACWPMPTSPSSGDSVPNHQSLTDAGDGTVKDTITCLTWEKSPPSEQGTLDAALARCADLAASKFAGYDDWRLPTRIEMASITDVTLGSTGYPTVFDVPSGYWATGSDWYKTILTDNDAIADNETNMAWAYGKNGFTSNALVRTDENKVSRCVRGNGSGEAQGEYAVEPPDHYTVSDDEALVTDNYTGLTWQRGRSPSLVAHADAAGYCESLSLGGFDDFRVPTLTELATTVNEAKVGGAVVDTAFPDNPVGCKAPEYWFWAAESSEIGGDGWGLSYCDGFTGWNSGSDGDWNYFPTANVRCVRNAQ